MLKKQEKRIRRHKRVRGKVQGTKDVPRLCIFRSSNHIYAQLIDDDKGIVIGSVSDLKIKKQGIAGAEETGKAIAALALEKKIQKVVFDRGGYKYHGRVKAVAEAARKAGLKL